MPPKYRVPFNFKHFSISQQVIKEMLTDRGYENVEEGIVDEDEFKTAVEKMPIELRATYDDKIVIVFWFSDGLNKAKMNTIMSIVEPSSKEAEIYKVVLVISGNISSSAKRAISICKDLFNVFDFTETQVNPTKHVLVPKHCLLTEEEKEKLLAYYKINAKQLHKIDVSERIIRWYDWKKGSVVLQTTDRCLVYLYVS